jgi:hypothetical protein
MFCSEAVTFSCSTERLNREDYTTILYSTPLPLNLNRTKVAKYYGLGLPKSFRDSNERTLSAFSQTLQSFSPFLGARHEANGDRGQSE